MTSQDWRAAVVLRSWLAAGAMLVAASTAGAQSTPGSPAEPETVRTGGIVYVVDTTGGETRGRLLNLSERSVQLLVGDAERRIPLETVSRIEARDSLKNGAITGAVVGVVIGALAAGISDCPNPSPGGPCPGTRAATFLISTGVYSALGIGIDALVHGRRTIYPPPRR